MLICINSPDPLDLFSLLFRTHLNQVKNSLPQTFLIEFQ